MSHNHAHCSEHEVAWCKICDVVYCKKCGVEWRKHSWSIYPWSDTLTTGTSYPADDVRYYDTLGNGNFTTSGPNQQQYHTH